MKSHWRTNKRGDHYVKKNKVHANVDGGAEDAARGRGKRLPAPIGDLSGFARKAVEDKVDSKITDTFDSETGKRLFEFANGENWYVFESIEDAEREALAQVRRDLEDEPEIFDQNWLQQHIMIGETDRRLIASEQGDSAVEDRDRDDLESMARSFNVAFDENTSDDTLRENVRVAISHDVKERLEDPIKYFVEDEGMYSREDLLKANFINIDIDKATQDAVSTDGIAHFLARYDGDEHSIRTKSGTIFMYRAN